MNAPNSEEIVAALREVMKALTLAVTGEIDGVVKSAKLAHELKCVNAAIARMAADGEWISVSEEMPDSEATVLVATTGADDPVWLGFHDGECWRYVNAEMIPLRVTHWRELPDPPQLAAAKDLVRRNTKP